MTNLLRFLQNLLFAIKSGQLPELGVWTYFLLVLLVVLEGPSATLLGAAAASAGLMRPTLVFLAATIGNLTADLLWYSIGYLGKADWLLRFRRFGIRKQLMDRLTRNMTTHVTKILLLAKFSLSFMIPTLITAGLLKIPWRRWFPTLILADTLWTGLLVIIGYYSLETIKSLKQGVEYAALFLVLLLATAFLVLRRRLKKQWEREAVGSGLGPED